MWCAKYPGKIPDSGLLLYNFKPKTITNENIMNTMNVTKKPRDVVTPPPKKYQWTEVPIKNKEGVVVKRPLEDVSPDIVEEAIEEEVEEEVPSEVVEEGTVAVEAKDSTDGI